MIILLTTWYCCILQRNTCEQLYICEQIMNAIIHKMHTGEVQCADTAVPSG